MTRRLTMPVLAIDAQFSFGAGVGDAMRLVAEDVQSLVIPGVGHWLAEEAPAEAFTSRIRRISPLPVNHADTRVKDKDATIASYRAVLGFDLNDGPVQARVRPRRLIHRRKVLG